MRLFLAVRVFFRVLTSRDVARQIQSALDGSAALPATAAAPPRQATPASKTKSTPASGRSDAISLLATLQREARFVDIVMEPLGDYSDAQIGAASRDVLRDCGQALRRMFDLQPEIDAAEGSEHQTPSSIEAARYRLTGNVSGDPPFTGRLAHHGWRAQRCELPQWTGGPDAAMIVAPVELEIE